MSQRAYKKAFLDFADPKNCREYMVARGVLNVSKEELLKREARKKKQRRRKPRHKK